MNTPDIAHMVETVKTARDAGHLLPLVPQLEQDIIDAETKYHKLRDWRGKNGQELAPEVIWEARQRLSTLKNMLALAKPKKES